MNTKSALSSEVAHGKWGQAGNQLQNCTSTWNKMSEVEPLALSRPVRAKSSFGTALLFSHTSAKGTAISYLYSSNIIFPSITTNSKTLLNYAYFV